ncbi:hypothetical protein AHAS_Ahas13G0147500 [Arachis hypogaea]
MRTAPTTQPLSQVRYRASNSAFSVAFQSVGMKWAKYVVAFGALKGMTTVLLVGALGQASYTTHIARSHMIPPWFALVHPKTGIPINATLLITISSACIAFFSSLDVLSSLLSISTLFIFMMMAVALLVRSKGFLRFREFHLLWLPSISIAINIFLMGSLDSSAFIRFGICTGEFTSIDMPLGTAIHNIEITLRKGGQLARAAGAVAKLIAKEGKSATLKLPSEEVRLISKNYSATIGQVGNVGVNQKTLGRAGSKCWLGKRPVVRGVVMNPGVVKGEPQLVEKNPQLLGVILHLEEEVEKGINIVII